MTGPRIGSLFSGTGQLDEAVRAAFGGEVVWHSQYEPPKDGKEDVHQYAAKILARHYPTVPNLGDITRIDWQHVTANHGPIDILTGGFPCQDVSSAGKRAGLTAGSRSGLWTHMAHAIHELQPELVVIENVQGLLSAQADRGLGSDAEALDDQAEAGGTLRALGAVLGDLATLGLHAEWCRVAASEVGAPHPRKRVFVLAWPAAADPGGFGRGNGPGILGGLGASRRGKEATADTTDFGHQRGRAARRRGPGPADGG
ncbi:DNA cytosine methyltransferase, partial [Streptomyces sp. NPDC059538]|uniref:DNA cytosine methyltransferase n=1 Tax=Streptomyces sp. NPDC059538 TaxID=3346860 RepID=UPI00368FE562